MGCIRECMQRWGVQGNAAFKQSLEVVLWLLKEGEKMLVLLGSSQGLCFFWVPPEHLSSHSPNSFKYLF